jgi:hypothetical protein
MDGKKLCKLLNTQTIKTMSVAEPKFREKDVLVVKQ